MAYLDDIPQEILNLIIRLLKSDARTLLNLCLTSHRFIHEAQLHLYSDITVAEIYTIKPLHIDLQQSAKLFTTFTTHNPALALYVKRFVYTPTILPRRNYERIMQQTLRLMTNLTFLGIDPYNPEELPSNLFENCAFQLTHFHFYCCMPSRREAHSFLSTSDELRSLYELVAVTDFPPECFSSLETLCTGDWNHAFKILAEYPNIRRLELYGSPIWGPSHLTPNVLENITVFNCKDLDDCESFEVAVPYLKRLRVLSLVGLLYITRIHGSREIITKLASLVVFIWSASRRRGPYIWDYWNPEANLGVVKIWFQKMPKLRKAYFQIGEYADDTENYVCWRRNKEEPTLVSHAEVVEKNGISDSHLINGRV